MEANALKVSLIEKKKCQGYITYVRLSSNPH
jgi:hypothetical protein